MGETTTSTTFPLWGGLALVATTDAAALGPAVAAVRATVDRFDLACSPFRADSELSALNASEGRPVVVSTVFLDAIAAALRGAELTDGDVDPTVGAALVRIGFHDDSAPERSTTLATVPGYATVKLDRDAGTVRLLPGVRLDLGATAKALAADRAAATAQEATGCGVLVSLSGDIATAGDPVPGGWPVRVTDDHRSAVDAPGQWIELHGGGLATSSTTVQRGQGSEHHVIDPATGGPAEVHFRTVSVAAASCLDANIASTAAIVRGERAVAWLDSLGLPSRLVRLDGTVLHLAGWPAEAEDLVLGAA